MKNIILLLALFPLFLSCTDDDKEEVKHDYFTDFVTGVTVGGDLRPTSIRIDNEMNKISIDFPIGSTPTAIPVELELASGVTMKSPSSTSNTFDLTEIIPIYLEYKGEDYRYLIVGNYLPESIGGGVMQNGPVHHYYIMVVLIALPGGQKKNCRQMSLIQTQQEKRTGFLILSCFWKHIQERVAILKMAWAD